MSRYEIFWTRLRGALTFLGGFGIAVYEVGWDKSDRFWPYGIAAAMMGLPLASAAESALDRLTRPKQTKENDKP